MANKPNTVAGAPLAPRAGAGAPVIWAKPGKGGIVHVIRMHAGGTQGALVACGKLQANSTYLQPAYKPLHVLYATTPQGAALVATGGTPYANGNTVANVVCVACCKLVPTFGALVARARRPKVAAPVTALVATNG